MNNNYDFKEENNLYNIGVVFMGSTDYVQGLCMTKPTEDIDVDHSIRRRNLNTCPMLTQCCDRFR